MKKVLFATTALVASAGIASAEVALSGSAEMGIVGGDGIETQFWTDIDVAFKMSGETDNGLSFGAVVDLDENGAFAGTTQGGESIFISGSFGTLTMGDTDNAFDWALQEVNLAGGSINDAETGHSGFNGNGANFYDGQVARYDYSFNDFSFAVSAELDDTGAGDPGLGVGVKYKGDLGGITVGVGIGYAAAGSNNEMVGGSLDATLASGISAAVNFSQRTVGAVKTTHIGVGAAYTINAITVAANYGVYNSDVAGVADVTGFGVTANYDLGGGAKVQFGFGSSDNGAAPDTNSFSLGLAMSF